MLWELQSAGARRLVVAAGISLAVHTAIALSVSREPWGNGPLSPSPGTTPLIARLATAVTASMLSGEPAAEPPPVTTAARVQTPPPVQSVPPSAGAATGPDAVYYFKASELDRRPFPLAHVEVPPPESAEAESGAVLIRLRISERGRVEDARIVMGTGIPQFEASALLEFSRARFHPGYRGNLPVRSEMLIEVTLRPPGGNGRSRAEPVRPND